MTNHSISGKHMRCILAMFWSGSLVLLGNYRNMGPDSWIAFLLAAVFFLPLLWIHTRLIQIYPEKNLFEMIYETFGKILGAVCSLFFIFFAIHLSSLVTRVFGEFIQALSMPETPQTLTIALILLIAYWSVTNGPENVGRTSKFLWNIIWLSVAATFFIGIKDMNFENLKPVMETDLTTLVGGGFSICMLSLGESILCLSFFSAVPKKESPKKIYLIALIGFLIVGLIAILRNVLILGPTVTSLYYFPSYAAVSVLTVGDFFSRIEVLIGIDLMIAGLVKISVCVYTASLGLTKVLHAPNQKTMVAPCIMLIIALAIPAFKNTIDIFDFFPYFTVYATVFEILLPFVLWITAEIKSRLKSAPARPEPAES